MNIPTRTSAVLRLWSVIVLAAALGAPPAVAQPGDETAIRDALTTWRDDFNAGRADKVCGLFARDLRFDYRGFPERDYDAMCKLLQRSLSDPSRHYSYALRINEVIVLGDTGIARVAWRLTMTPTGGAAITSEEPGLDVFRRQADGSWKIIRYMGFEAPQ